jgi:nitrogen fixation NifU-like protein
MRNYSPQVIDHFTNPRNQGTLANPDATAEAANPCCGDRIRLQVRVSEGRIVACTFLAYGCAVALAVASLLSEAVTGQSIDALTAFDETRVEELTGGLRPGQRHCAVLGKNVLHALAANYRTSHTKGNLP